MANQADGSIIVDTELNSDGFKAGSAELLAAIKSLSNEVKTLGQTLKETFGGSDKSVGATDGKVQALEATIASLQAQVKSLQDTVATLQEKLDGLNSSKSEQTPLDGVSDAAKGANEQVTALEAKIQELEGVIAGMQTQLDAAASAPSEVDFDTDAAEAKIAALEDKVSELERTLADLQNGEGGTATPAVDFGGTPQKASSLQKQIDAVNSSVDRLGPTFQRAMDGSESAVTSFRSKAESLNGQIEKLEQQLQAVGDAQIPTQEYQNVSVELEKAEEKFNALLAKQEKMQAMGVSMDSNQWKSMQYDMELVSNKYHELLALKKQLEESGGAYVAGADTAQYAQMESALSAATQQLQYMESEIDRVNSKWAQMPTFTGYIRSAISSIGSTIKSTFSGIGTVITHPLQSADRLLGAMVQKAGQFVRITATFAVSKLTSGLKSAAASMAKTVTHGRSMNNQFSGLISGAKKFTLSLLGARGVYALLRKAVSAYMQENEQLSATLSACWSGIGNILGPIITRIINLVATATAYVTKFLNLLGFVGNNTEKAISKAGGAAKKESDKLQRNLASFDELNILGDKTSDSADTDVSAELPNVELPDWARLIVDKLKSGQWAEAAKTLTGSLNDMVSGVDWAGLGGKIGYYINGALTFLATAITTFDWYNLGASLGELINNAIYGVDWANLGIVLGWKIIALIEGLGGLFATIDWAALGKALADAFTGLWNAIDWVQAAKTLSDGVIGLLNLLSTAIKNVDWQKLGRDIATFIANIDWGGVTTALFDGIGAALGGLTAFLWGLIQDAWQSVVDWWYDVAYEDGSFTIDGLLEGICNAICNIGQWIVDHIFTPFINGFKSAFGIHSPSTVMAEQGAFIVEGLLIGLQNGWEAFAEWISAAFAELLSIVIGWAVNAGKAISSWVTEIGANIRDWAIDAISNFKSWATDTKSQVTKWVSNVSSSISTWASDTETKVKDWTTITSEKIASWVETTKANVAEWANNTKERISTWAGNTKTDITSWVASTKFSIAAWGANVYATIQSKTNSIRATITSGFSSIRTSMVADMQSAMLAIRSQDWFGIGSNICSGIGDGLRRGWSWLTSLVYDIANSLYRAACSALGIHSPSRLFRDGVGLNIGYGVGEGIEASKGSILDSVVGVADAIASEFNANEYSIGGVVSNTEVSGALTAFSDTIANSFSSLMNRLQAIADSVVFSVPAVACGNIIPSNVVAATSRDSVAEDSRYENMLAAIADLVGSDIASFEAILEKLDEIRKAIDEIEIGDTTIGEANQRYVRKMNVIRGVNA